MSAWIGVAAMSLACHRNPAGQGPHSASSSGSGVAGGGASSGADLGPGYPGELIPTQEMGPDFLARQKLEGTFGEREFAFEAVLQLRDGTLTVLGLTPFGTKAFVLTQTGTEVAFELLIDRELPFPPEYMLQDIHRAWLWQARLPWGAGPPSDEAPTTEVAGERISEQWTANGLVRRSFERLDGAPAGVIRVDYVGGHQSGQPAKQVVLDNGWFGYRLEIETIDWRML
ncbi:hypothetical protein DB30_05154 [Enhygromyxa salina]|uniref:DUF3261 domain-containing protein n=1 Tax=Enhygromyxa salina TaxID=215803 RepID=A0A0C2D741_9BACT|nr:hypothetical protein DB30_05154 [Enhygromyxa salina]